MDEYFVTEEDLREAGKYDNDSEWSQVDVVGLDPNGYCLNYFDPVGFRYHLPAYMSSALRYSYSLLCDSRLETLLNSSIIASLSSDDPEDTAKYKALNAQQSRCVARFIVLDLELDYDWDDDSHVKSTRNYLAMTGHWRPFVEHADWKQIRSIWPKAF